jgi:hypothetical protein
MRPQLPGSAQNDQTFSFLPNGLSLVRDADTLHIVGSCHDPTTCKVLPKTNGWMPTFSPFGALPGKKKKTAFDHLGRSQPSPVYDVDTLHVVGS